MQYFNIFTVALLPTVLAGYGYGDSSDAAPTKSAVAQAAAAAPSGTHIIKVGNNAGGLVFEPANMTIPVGETAEFHFWPKAHSVAQSSFDKPCQPLNETVGFFSGPIAVASGMSPSVYRVTVNSTAPIWFYCATGRHCQSGMSGVINAPASNPARTLALYQKAAAEAQNNVTPPKVQGGVIAAAAASGSGTPTGSSPTGSSTPGAAVRGSVSWAMVAGVGAIGAFLV